MAQSHPWSSWHDRLHRQLLRQPDLLPKKTSLLLAISGGQDSMVLLVLLKDLVRLHHWDLMVWHGDHGWHAGSATIAQGLKAWCDQQGVPIVCSHAEANSTASEAAARQWRYQELGMHAKHEQRDVVTGHTATDRAETLLLQMARGTNLAGLGSLRPKRPLDSAAPSGPQLRRPLLSFSRDETLLICQELKLPIWLDPSNANPTYARNRLRQHVLPVLEDLHPGSTRRLAELAERVSQVRDTQQELSQIVLKEYLNQDQQLNRQKLNQLNERTKQTLLHTWLQQAKITTSNHNILDITQRTSNHQPPGSIDLPGDKQLTWDREWLTLQTVEPKS